MLCYKPGELVIVECKGSIQKGDADGIVKRLQRITDKFNLRDLGFLTPAYKNKYEAILRGDASIEARPVIIYDNCSDACRETIEATLPKVGQLAARDLLAQLLRAVSDDWNADRGSGGRRNDAILRTLWQLAERGWIDTNAVTKHLEGVHLGHPEKFLR